MRDIQPDMITKKGSISCARVARILERYLDGELDVSRRAKVAAHLSAGRRGGLDEQSSHEINPDLEKRRHEVPAGPIDLLRNFAAGIATPDAPDGGEGTTS